MKRAASAATPDARRRPTGVVVAPTTAALPGGRFGTFRFLERIERGGPAELYHALWSSAPSSAQRLVLLKRLRPELTTSPAFVRMFEDEAQIMAELRHPNIVRIYERGTLEGVPYLAMEILDGIDLGRLQLALRAAQQKLAIEVAVHIAKLVADGLGHAHAARDPEGHSLRVVHRELRPNNILLLRAGGLKLVEFGVARVSSFVSQGPVSQGPVGKPSYLAPEQIAGGNVDARTDLYALGVILWELLTGRPLFPARTREPAEAAAELARPSTMRPDVPAALDDLVVQLLARDPALRYQTADQVSRVLAPLSPSPADATRALTSLVRASASDSGPQLPGRIPGSLQAGTRAVPALLSLLGGSAAARLAQLPGSLRRVTSMVPVLVGKLPKRRPSRPAATPARALDADVSTGLSKTPLPPPVVTGQYPVSRAPFTRLSTRALAVAALAFVGGALWQGIRGGHPSPNASRAPQTAPFTVVAAGLGAGVVIETLPARASPPAVPIAAGAAPAPAPPTLPRKAGRGHPQRTRGGGRPARAHGGHVRRS